ncbi:MAG: phosphodiester glycosidase family protein [Anaerolineae bacterium]
MTKIEKSEQRVVHDDGQFSDVVTFKVPSSRLQFADIDQQDSQVKLQDVAEYRAAILQGEGEIDPTIVTFNLLFPDRPAAEVFPNLHAVTDEGERLLSANSLITYTMRHLFAQNWVAYKNKTWETVTPESKGVWHKRGAAVLGLLVEQNRTYIHHGGDDGDSADFRQTPLVFGKHLIPISRCGFLSDFNNQKKPELVFNAAYFLLELDDVLGHHSNLGDAYGFWMIDGVINRPVLFNRGAIWQHSDGQWEVGRLTLTDFCLKLPNRWRLTHQSHEKEADGQEHRFRYSLNDESPLDIHLYTRYYGVTGRGQVIGSTPKNGDRLELVVINRRIVGWKRGGGMLIPHNAIVISIDTSVLKDAEQELANALSRNIWLDYEFVTERHKAIVQGIQAGPILLKDGRTPLTNSYLEEAEQFWPSRMVENEQWQIGVVSTSYRTDIDETRAGRVGVGINSEGDLIVILVPGVNHGMSVPGADSSGATLTEIANLLRDAGAVDAINLDGGGSAQAYFQNSQAVVPGDRRNKPGHSFERMIPSVGFAE